MAAPTLVASYFVVSGNSGDSNSLVTPAFTPSNGEVLVIKGATWDTGTTLGTPSGGGQTYTQRAVGAPGGFACYTVIYTAVVSGSPGSMTVTVGPPSSSCFHSMVVERWSGAQLAATPATSSPVHNSSSAPLATITTTANDSIVTWVNADDNSSSGSGVYRSGATEENVAGAGGTNSVHYYAYQTATTAGSQTIGMTAPLDPNHSNTQNWTMTGIEVQAAGASSFSPANSSAFLTFFQ